MVELNELLLYGAAVSTGVGIVCFPLLARGVCDSVYQGLRARVAVKLLEEGLPVSDPRIRWVSSELRAEDSLGTARGILGKSKTRLLEIATGNYEGSFN